ncbi:ATP-binding cassette domain-containing protein [Rhodococcus erythropolis]
MNALQVADAVVEYDGKGSRPVRAVNGVSLTVEPGQIVGLVGESGCGKSSLARVAAGLTPPTSGSVQLHGARVTPMGWKRRSADQLRLQMIFQNPFSSLNPRRTVGDQLEDGVPEHIRGKGRRTKALAQLEKVGMPPSAASRYPHQFSGGQLQRIAIARALVAEPSVLIADEPVTALDASSQVHVVSTLISLVKELDVGMLFISHDLSLVRHIADVTAVMYLGKLVEVAPTDQLWARPRHPYTASLIAAIPRVEAGAGLPLSLAGDIPDPSNAPRGCNFRPRCAHSTDTCFSEPPLIRTAQTQVACWLEVQ